MSQRVTIDSVVKRYGNFTAVDQISLTIEPGEFFTLLGPSGCGKTTLLRMIAGFNTIDEGSIYFDEKKINHVEAHKRDIGMVFQNYAIFPHLTVYENVAYGLKAKRVKRGDIETRVAAALEQVQIQALRSRRPNELSGGQQQRVALARAFVIEPGVLLMDEPLSNLDAKLRVQMRMVIKKLQRRLGITTIYVTHDQEEALAISDRIAVIKDGKVMQCGTPEQIYKRPENPFVANFIGVSNTLPCTVTSQADNTGKLTCGDYSVIAPLRKRYDGEATISARPEQLFFADKGLAGTIVLSTFLGDFVEYEVQLASGQILQVNEYTKDTPALREDGSEVHIVFDPARINLYAADTEEVLSC